MGIWISLLLKVYSTLPKTFAWEKLLPIFGSTYDDCVDRTGVAEVVLTLPRYCEYRHTLPAIPAFAILMFIFNIIGAIMAVATCHNVKSLWLPGVINYSVWINLHKFA